MYVFADNMYYLCVFARDTCFWEYVSHLQLMNICICNWKQCICDWKQCIWNAIVGYMYLRFLNAMNLHFSTCVFVIESHVFENADVDYMYLPLLDKWLCICDAYLRFVKLVILVCTIVANWLASESSELTMNNLKNTFSVYVFDICLWILFCLLGCLFMMC